MRRGRRAKLERFERGVRCAVALLAGQVINRRWLCEHLELSPAQAKRDLNELERVLPVHRAAGRLTLLAGVRVIGRSS